MSTTTNFTPNAPVYYTNQFTAVNDSLDSLLDEFKTNYALYKSNPTNQTYQSTYTNTIANINSKLTEMNRMVTSMNTEITTMNNLIIQLNTNIQSKKSLNLELKTDLGSVSDKNMTSQEQIEDYSDIYNESYIRNIALLLTIFGSMYVFGFSKNIV